MDHIDPNDLKYSTDDFRVDTHPNQGVIIENGPQKKNDVTALKNGEPISYKWFYGSCIKCLHICSIVFLKQSQQKEEKKNSNLL